MDGLSHGVKELKTTNDEDTRVDESRSANSPTGSTAGSDGGDSGVVRSVAYARSVSIARLAGALAKAQGSIEGASKDKTNPHFKSSYADLASVWEACRAPLSANGIAVLQPASADGPRVTLTTILAHSSGEWISMDLTMTAGQNTPQAIGSCITYARRYALASMVGVAPEDDDGNAATHVSGASAAQGKVNGNGGNGVGAPSPDGFEPWLDDLTASADEGTSQLMAAFNGGRPECRTYLTSKRNATWEGLKSKASKVKAVAHA